MSEFCSKISSPAAPAELGLKEASESGRPRKRLCSHPGEMMQAGNKAGTEGLGAGPKGAAKGAR